MAGASYVFEEDREIVDKSFLRIDVLVFVACESFGVVVKKVLGLLLVVECVIAGSFSLRDVVYCENKDFFAILAEEVKAHHRPYTSSTLDRILPYRLPVMPVMTPPAFVKVGTGDEDDAVAMEQKLCWSRHIFRADFRMIPLVCRFSLSWWVSWNVKILAPIVRIV